MNLVLAPDFDRSRLIYVTFTQKVEGGNLTAVGRGKLADDEQRIEQFEVIFQASPVYERTQQYGSRLILTTQAICS